MAAPVGNSFWQLRSSHGRDKIFSDPDTMWDACVEYFAWCKENPLIEEDWVGKDAVKVERKKMRAFTMSGLCLFLGVNTLYFSQFENGIKDKTDQLTKDFSLVLSRIRDTLYTQKFEGAAAGLLNPNIIARDLGLADKKEITDTGTKKIVIEGQKFAGKTDGDTA